MRKSSGHTSVNEAADVVDVEEVRWIDDWFSLGCGDLGLRLGVVHGFSLISGVRKKLMIFDSATFLSSTS